MLFNCQFGAYENKLYYAGFTKYYSGMRGGDTPVGEGKLPLWGDGKFCWKNYVIG